MTQTLFGPRIGNETTEFRLWAPSVDRLALAIEGQADVPMTRRDGDWWAASAPGGAGTLYRFRLPDGSLVPDPASRFQPQGVHGPSAVVDPHAFAWRCTAWHGRPWHETVLYEVHAGLMGGYRGVADALPALAQLGITAIELMPLAAVSGQRNWGYDGVLPFAPAESCGTPDELKALIDRAHELGLMVFLDVVYNHFGPDGNWLHAYAEAFFRSDIATPWGAAIDFRKAPVRRFFTENALHWLGEYRFDGLRLDAVHAISEQDWLGEMAREVRAAFPDRHIHLVLENEHNTASHLRGDFNAQWNDDFHNVMHVLLTGETTAYYKDFAQDPAAKLARALGEGFIYQGEASINQNGKARGSPSKDLKPSAFVDFLQNHDQVGNRAMGERLTVLADPQALRAATALLLLIPHIPLIFMGDEVGAQSPFLFFTDFHDELADAVREGRRKEFAGHPAFSDEAQRERIPDPNAAATFERSKMATPSPDAEDWHSLYKTLLDLRHREIVPGLPDTRALGSSVLGEKAVRGVWRLGDGRCLKLAINLGTESVSVPDPGQRVIWGDAPQGQLPGASIVVWLDHA